MENEKLNNLFLNGKRPYLWLAAAVLLLYLPAVSFGLTRLDDEFLLDHGRYLLENPGEMVNIFFRDLFANQSLPYFRPVLLLSFLPDVLIGGPHSLAMAHFFNILIHLGAVWLLFKLLSELGYSGRDARYIERSAHYRKGPSFFASVFFAVHPVLTQAVAWIPGRNDSLLAVFVFASFIFFLRFLEKEKKSDCFWHISFFIMALLTKETAVFLAPVYFLYILVVRNDLKLFSKKVVFLVGNWFLFTGGWFLMRANALGSGQGGKEWLSLNNLPAILQYTGKIFFPFNLSVQPFIKDTTFIYGIVALIVLFLLFFFSKKPRLNFIVFGILWYLLFLLPAVISHNPNVSHDTEMEHRVYLPLAGFLIFMLEMNICRNWRIKEAVKTGSAALLIVFFAILAFWHSLVFRDMMSFFENAVKYSPSLPFAHRELGTAYFFADMFDKAEFEYKKTLELNPGEMFVHNNLGVLYMNRKNFSEAEKEFKKELEIFPDSDRAYSNLGLLFLRQGKTDEAVKWWQEGLKINPGNQEILGFLSAYGQQKNEAD